MYIIYHVMYITVNTICHVHYKFLPVMDITFAVMVKLINMFPEV